MYQLDLLCFAEPFRFTLPLMRDLVLQPRSMALLAHSADHLAGFILVEVAPARRSLQRGSAYLNTLDVHPEDRRRGLARALLAAAEHAAVEAAAAHFDLHVSTHNDAATSFYEASGFLRLSQVRNFYGAGLHAFQYRKDLRPFLEVSR